MTVNIWALLEAVLSCSRDREPQKCLCNPSIFLGPIRVHKCPPFHRPPCVWEAEEPGGESVSVTPLLRVTERFGIRMS